jgi:DNA-binding NarL/FixJ family response regulator
MEGMPLGLELAATWLRVMPCGQIAAQMGSNLDFLTTSLRNIPERHRSLRNVFEQSWHFLSSTEQSVLMKLSVFRGGFDLEAAEQVAGASLAILAGLADKSLIRLNPSGRYDLHELLRQYAADKMLDAGQTNTTIQHHLDYFLKLAEEAESHEFGREQIPWFDRLETDLDNIRAALAWSLESEKGLHLAAALGWFFSERSHWVEGLDWLEQMLAANEDAPASLRAKALHSAASQALMLGDSQKVHSFCEQALNLARAANDRWNIAWSLSHMGFRFEIDGNFDESRASLEESLSLFRELQDPMGLCHNLVRRAFLALGQRREYAYILVLIDEASIYAQKADDKIILGWIEYLRGMVYWLQNNDVRQAKFHYESSLSFFREARFWGGVNLVLSLVASVEHLIGDDALAQTHFEEALILQNQIMDTMEDSLIGLASLASARGQFLRAAKLLGAARNNIMISAIKLFPEIFTYERDVDALRAQLGEADFNEVWAAGKAMTREQAVAYALEGRTMSAKAVNNRDINQPPQANAPAMIESLSARELQVLRLIAEGLSNAEIAQKLFLTVGTVKVHSRNIYGKLSANNRTQAVAQAQKLNLL